LTNGKSKQNFITTGKGGVVLMEQPPRWLCWMQICWIPICNWCSRQLFA